MRPHAPSGSATPAVSDRTGDYLVLPDWSPLSPDLYGCPGSRETLAPSLKSRDEGTHAPRGKRRPCASDVRGLVCLPSGSSTPDVSDGTGGQASYSFFQSCYRHPFGQHRQGSAAVAKCHPWFLILERFPRQRRWEPRTLQTSRVTRGRLALNFEAVACKVGSLCASTS